MIELQKCRVLHISTYYPPHIGGVEQTAMDVVESLKEEFEQTVFAFNHVKGKSISVVDNVVINKCSVLLKAFSQPISIHYKSALKDFLDAFKPNIITIHFPNPFGIHYLLKLLQKRRYEHIKLITYYHSDIVKQKILKQFFKGQTERLLRRSTKIIATSPNYIDGSKFLSKFKEKCYVVPSCINSQVMDITSEDVKHGEEIHKLFPNRILCVFVGRHVGYKGINCLIDATDFLSNNVEILIVGNGPLTKKLKDQAKHKSNVHFVGVQQNIKPYLLACDIFTFPSVTRNEAFGLALAEAMWYGKPAVTFSIKNSGVNFVGLKDVTCLECQNGDIVDYANAINRLVNNDELRSSLGIMGKKRAEELFTPNVFRQKILSIYKQIANENRN